MIQHFLMFEESLPTPALFEATPGTYTRLLQGATRSQSVGRPVFAMPPVTEEYRTRDGRIIEVPRRQEVLDQY